MIKINDVKLKELTLKQQIKISLIVNDTDLKSIAKLVKVDKSLFSLAMNGYNSTGKGFTKVKAWFLNNFGVEI